jgi:WD40 repeat protein
VRTAALLSVALLVGCKPAPPPGGVSFVRGGVIGPAGSGGRAIGGDREFVQRAWTPGESVKLPSGAHDVAPAAPECAPMFHVDLGDVDALVSLGIEAPNTALAWSPDGNWLAVGTYLGEVLVVDGWTGAVRARRSLAETMIKAVAWSPDGAVVYASEQSPDAYLHALSTTELKNLWRHRLADELESSPPPPDTEIYGVYTLPGAYTIDVLSGGDLLVSALHSWKKDGVATNASRLYRFAPDGEPLMAWPKDGVADATLQFPRVDEEHDQVAVIVNRSAAGPAPEGLPVGGIQVLSLSGFEPRGQYVAEALKPHFTSARMWEAVDIAGEHLFVGYSDGRARLWTRDGGFADVELGTPILAGDVPISATLGWGFISGDAFVVNTGDTNIPWGSQTTATRPPEAHPRENSLWVHGLDGQLRWTWRGEHAVQGISPSPDGRHLVMGAGKRSTDDRRDLFGALIFRLEGEGNGPDRLQVTCPTESPVFFRQALRDDGRVAVAEFPFGTDAGVTGEYRLTVLR